MVFNPDRWMSSMIDSMQGEIKARVTAYLGVDDDEAVEILMDHFASESNNDVPSTISEMDIPLVHFSIDDVSNRNLGFGRGVVNGVVVEPTLLDAGTLTEHRGREHRVNFDVGVVVTPNAGGSSARFRVYEILDSIFNNADNKTLFETNTGGVEIISFDTGRFALDKINDVQVFRIVGAELIVRVYSRDVASDPVYIVDQEPLQQPDVEISGSHIVDD